MKHMRQMAYWEALRNEMVDILDEHDAVKIVCDTPALWEELAGFVWEEVRAEAVDRLYVKGLFYMNGGV